MEYYFCILEEYLKMNTENWSFNEIYEILNQLNNSFKIMIKKEIIHYDIKLSNIWLR